MSEQDRQQEYEEEDQYQPTESNKEVLIRLSDMQPQNQCAVVSLANAAIEEVADLVGIPQAQKYSKMAGILKRQLDNKLEGGWYVMCGKNFGTFVTHELGTFIHFSFDDLHICVFRAS